MQRCLKGKLRKKCKSEHDGEMQDLLLKCQKISSALSQTVF